MRLGFTSILALHWAVFFAFAAYESIANGHGPLVAQYGIAPIQVDAPGLAVLLAVILSGSFAFAAMLFGWTFLSAFVPGLHTDDEYIDLSRVAYCAAVSTLTIVMILSVARNAAVPHVAVAAQLVALAASYLVSSAERLHAALKLSPETNETKSAVRMMALGAAHGAMLSRIAGRNVAVPDGAR
jgi:hypothetical protein